MKWFDVGPGWVKDSAFTLPGPRRMPRPQQKFSRFRTCMQLGAMGSDHRTSMSANVYARPGLFGDACVDLATVTRRTPWDVLCPLLACDASNAEEMDRAGCGDAGCSGCPR